MLYLSLGVVAFHRVDENIQFKLGLLCCGLWIVSSWQKFSQLTFEFNSCMVSQKNFLYPVNIGIAFVSLYLFCWECGKGAGLAWLVLDVPCRRSIISCNAPLMPTLESAIRFASSSYLPSRCLRLCNCACCRSTDDKELVLPTCIQPQPESFKEITRLGVQLIFYWL